MLKINDRIVLPLSELQWDFARSGGPGGQNVNKVNSKALLRWNPVTSPSLPEPVRARLLKAIGSRLTGEGELLITSQETRDQARNMADCMSKLRALILSSATPPKVRRPTRPTHASQIRRVEAKSRRAVVKRLRRKPDPE